MDLFELFLLAVGLSMDAFAVAIYMILRYNNRLRSLYVIEMHIPQRRKRLWYI